MAKAKAMPKQLRNEIRSVLEHFIEWNREAVPITLPSVDPLRVEAVRYLVDIGALEPQTLLSNLAPQYFRVTASGREYWEKLTTFPPWYWFKKNWFPASIAAITFLASVGGIIATILTRQTSAM